MGQIGKEHISVEQIKSKIGNHTASLMKELHKLGTAAQTKSAIDEGLNLLRQIEDVSGANLAGGGPAHAVVYIEQAILGAGGTYEGPNTRSAFGDSFVERFLTQNSDSGLDLSTTDEAKTAAAAIKVPAGYGSYAGFKAIEKAYHAANKVDAEFTDATGLPGDVGRRASNFLAVFNEYVNQATSFFAGSLGVDPRQISPWWLQGNSAHVIWDAVVTPQHRLPILALSLEKGAVPTATPLLYSPRLLATVPDNVKFGFANPAAPKTIIDLKSNASVAGLRTYYATSKTDGIRDLDPALQPLLSTNESPALANSILQNYVRQKYFESQKPGLQIGGAPVPMQGVVSSVSAGKRSASSMSTSGRAMTLSAFGGAAAAAALDAKPAKQARVVRSAAAYGSGDIKAELSTDNFVELWDEIDSDLSLDPISKMNCKRAYL